MAMNEDERLSRVLRHCARTLVQQERSQGEHASVLGILAGHGTMTEDDLTKKLGLSTASADELLAKMEADGLVQRTTGSEGSDTHHLELTETGMQEARRIQQERSAQDAELFAALDASEKQELTSLLDKLATSWRRRPQE